MVNYAIQKPLGLRIALVALWIGIGGCRGLPPAPIPSPMAVPPTGEFVDDYGIRYTIGPHTWTQHPNATYHVTDWNADKQFAIAQNDENNASDAGLWTRIDWIRLNGDTGYTWAYCYAVYNASTRNEAITAPPSDCDTPRTGCNGFPFSRMKRATVE